MPNPTQDVDETARLILMEKPNITLINFAQKLKELHPDLVDRVSVGAALWGKYRGFDGRSRPTHDFWTGERIY